MSSWLILVVLYSIPVVVYLSVKLGTFAFFRGRELFEQQRTKEHRNGGTTAT